MAAVPLDIEAEVVGARPGATRRRRRTVRGQVAGGDDARAGRRGARCVPDDPPACPEAVAAIARRRLGRARPGLVVHQRHPAPAVPELRRGAVRDAGAQRMRGAQPRARRPGRPTGFSAENHLEVLAAHAPDLTLDVVLADPRVVDDDRRAAPTWPPRSAPSWSWPTWPSRDDAGRARPAAPGRGLPRRHGLTPGPTSAGHDARASRADGRDACRWQDDAHGDDGAGQGRAEPARR